MVSEQREANSQPKARTHSARKIKFEFNCKVCPMSDRCAYYGKNSKKCVILEEKMKNIEEMSDLDLLDFVMKEKMKRYLLARMYEESDKSRFLSRETTKLEDGLIDLFSLFLKLKYPSTFAQQGGEDEEIMKKILAEIEKDKTKEEGNVSE